MCLEENLKRYCNMPRKAKKNVKKIAQKAIAEKHVDDHGIVIFDGKMRKALVEGVLQNIKHIIESSTHEEVIVAYEDYALKSHEFGFKMTVSRGEFCKKQTFSEVVSAIANAMSYMFPGDNEQYDISLAAEDSMLEVVVISNW